MMKAKSLFFIACSLCPVLLSCLHEEPIRSADEATLSIMVQDFQFTTDAFIKGNNENTSTKASLSEAFQCLTIAVFNAAGEKIEEFNQIKSASDFGVVQCSLPFGTYRIVAVGYDSNDGTFCQVKSMNEVDFCQSRVPETFSATELVDITSTGSKTLVLNLERRIARLSFTTIDTVPYSCVNTSMNMTVKGVGKLLNPVTGLAAQTDSIVDNVLVSVGKPLTKSINCFLPEDSCGVKVIAEVMNYAKELILARTFNNVPLQRNHKTEATGTFFQQSTLQISAATEWGATHSFAY